MTIGRKEKRRTRSFRTFRETTHGNPDFITVIDESHVTVPQLSAMYAGDRARKDVLVDHGFRLPSARDNRPLTSEEFFDRVGPIIYTSATPGDFEREESGSHLVEQVIRPTGLVDPSISVQPVTGSDEYPRTSSSLLLMRRKRKSKKEIAFW